MSLINANLMLQHADRHGYAIGAFDLVSLEFLNGILKAAEDKHSPVILLIAEVHFKYVDIEQITPAIEHMASKSSVPVVLGLDHGETIETVVRAIRCGFSSVMFDGSKLPFEENVRQTSLAVQIAHSVGVSVEAELGRVGGAEGSDQLAVAHEEFFTDPKQAEEFVRHTGVDALAIAIGNAHGLYKGTPKLDFERLEAIKKLVPVPIVLHGGSGISDDDFRRAVKLGISKVNFFTEMSREAVVKVRRMLEENPNIIGLQDLMLGATETIEKVVADRIDVFGSAGICDRFSDLCAACGSCSFAAASASVPASVPASAPLNEERLVELVAEVVAQTLKARSSCTC